MEDNKDSGAEKTGTELEHAFTVYARVTDMDKDKKNWYEDSIRSMATFRTVEQFWGMY